MNEDDAGTHDPATRADPLLNRRTLMTGAAGAGLAAAGYLSLAGAQDESATPAAEATEDEASATPEAATSTEETSRAVSILEEAQAALAAAEADRDAVAAEIETATADDVLGQARLLLDDAQAALDGGDIEEAVRLAAGAWQSAEAAGELIEAQLTFAGLPSQEASASRVLVRAYERISAVTEDAAAVEDDNVTFYVTTAQTVYETAYDQYGDGAYAQAMANGKAVGALVGTASILSGSDSAERALGGQFEGGFGRGDRDRGPQLPMDVQPAPDAGDEPETVPVPDF